jgi:hypothetical protein
MDLADSKFFQDLQREDDVGLVLLGHIHLEHQLIELISAVLPYPDRCDWQRVNYATKVAFAHACGLPERLRDPLTKIGKLRNDFAHSLDADLSRESVMALYNGLPELYQSTLKESYRAMGLGAFPGPAKLPPRDLLVLIMLNIRQAIKAGVLALKRREP